MAQIRIEKYIADLTNLSRNEVKNKLKKKAIKVNGVILTKLIKIDPEKDVVELDNGILKYEKFQYYMFNKPANFICANSDSEEATIFDIVGLPAEKFFSFGRLDKDTEGLLILSNDGQMCHRLLSPKNHVPKKYYVKVDRKIDSEILLNNSPIKINDDFVVSKYILELIDDKSCFLTIYEGKFHQIKRMFGALGFSVLYLKRVEFGKLKLDNNLKLGQVRKLSEDEVKLLESA
ncbi:rRNA pseudouridine synthase [Mycoplasmopsis agalactiae]|uniref:pseudouridine synthase n=1 Tax=Mycoplasmopsis agalactiae TaxID=2110 RepID=UPI001F3DA37F|nr:pseudouridine synthase [Mycoplasmopsis agalactiae]MCE6061812.1 rRNA pseudouridine synthase [Mycoplasmopsis agalactiae]